MSNPLNTSFNSINFNRENRGLPHLDPNAGYEVRIISSKESILTKVHPNGDREVIHIDGSQLTISDRFKVNEIYYAYMREEARKLSEYARKSVMELEALVNTRGPAPVIQEVQEVAVVGRSTCVKNNCTRVKNAIVWFFFAIFNFFSGLRHSNRV